MRGIKLYAALLGLSAIGATLVAAPAQADLNSWSITSAYTFPTSVAANNQGTTGTIVRVTFDVPDGLDYLNYETSGGDTSNGGVQTYAGYAVLDLTETAGPDGQFMPTDVTFSDPASNDPLWKGTVSAATPATETKLTVSSVPKAVRAGSSIPVSGTLTKADGSSLTGHWVMLADYRRKSCADGVSYCERFYQNIGQAQVDSTGHWKTTMPVRWTTHLVATYCGQPGTCWNNSNSPAFAPVSTVTAKWAPTVKLPSRIRKDHAASYVATVSAGFTGLPVKLQAYLAGQWKTVASGKLTAARTATLAAKLPVAGKVKVRAYVPGFTRYMPGKRSFLTALVVNTGHSPATTARVVR